MRATRAPPSEVSTTSASVSRVKSSTTTKIRNRRPDQVTSATKSIDHRSLGRAGAASTVLALAAIRFRFFVRTASPSCL